MRPLSLWLSWKYLRFGKKDKSISFMIKICFLGILIGTFALMLTLIITNGFEKVIHEKMQGITSQAIIYSPGNKLDDESIKKALNKEFGDVIKAMSSSSIRQVIIEKNKKRSVLFLKGVEPKAEGKVSSIGKKVIFPIGTKNVLKKLLHENHIIIGYKTARQHNLSIGSELTLMVPEPSSKKKIFLKKKKATVKGIFKVGLEEYDNNFAYCSLGFLKSIFEEKKGVDQISLKFRSQKELSILQRIARIFSFQKSYEESILEILRESLPGLTVNSWQELYPALVSSLKLEKYVMFFILVLITLVACMNMISLLFMQIQQKRRDIAIFKTMGMAYKNIKRLFLSIGMFITFFASLTGLALAACAGYLLEKYPFIELPDVYYVSYLPARMDPEIFIIVFVCTIILGFLATWIPTKRARKINVVDVLRQE